MDFAAVAHDLRAPLTAMLGHTQLLAVEGLSDDGRRRLEVMEAQIRRMVTLIERCLPQVEQPGRAAPVDVSVTIGAVIAELEAVCDRRQIQVTVTGDAALPPVIGDAEELHRLLMNLFVNAIEALPDGGRILVRARVGTMRNGSSSAVEIGITDTGGGIPPDIVPRIFERGFTTKSPGQGTGLGLAICREIVLGHGGAIDVRTAVGHGTTVQVCLPTGGGTA